jgi:hypothetical protein
VSAGGMDQLAPPQEMTLAGGFYNNIVEINIILRLLSPYQMLLKSRNKNNKKFNRSR